MKNYKNMVVLSMVLALFATVGIVSANTWYPTINTRYVDSNYWDTYFNSSDCHVGGPYPTLNIGKHWSNGQNQSIYFEFNTHAIGNGLYPNATISDAQLCLGIKDVGYADFSSSIYAKIYEVFPNVTQWNDDLYPPEPGFSYWANNISYGNQPCGIGNNNGTFCNNTAAYSIYMKSTYYIAHPMKVCYNITDLAQKGINQSGWVRFVMWPEELNHYYLYLQYFNCVFDPVAGYPAETIEWLPHLQVTCGATYEDFYNDSNCYTVEYTTTTTAPPAATTTIDDTSQLLQTSVNGTATWIGAIFGTDNIGGKLIVWTLLCMLLALLPMYYKLTRDFTASAIIFLAFFLVGVLIGWVPAWIGVTFIVICGALIAFTLNKMRGG